MQKIKIDKKTYVDIKNIASYEHNVSEANNRQYLKLNLRDGNPVQPFDNKAFDATKVAEVLHKAKIKGVCPNCTELNNDNWPLRIGGNVLSGGCQECWEGGAI